MTTERVREFLEQARTDAALGEKYRSRLEGAMMKTIADVAHEHGFAVTTEELRDHFSREGAELSEHDLGAAVGGVGNYDPARPNLVMTAAAGVFRK